MALDLWIVFALKKLVAGSALLLLVRRLHFKKIISYHMRIKDTKQCVNALESNSSKSGGESEFK